MVKKILIVDNDVDFANACKIFLESCGHEVIYETNEDNVVTVINNFKPQLILLDIVMKKETSGFEIVSQISLDKNIATIPVIFLTGYFKKDSLTNRDNETIKKWENVKGILDKPVKPNVLIEEINKLIK